MIFKICYNRESTLHLLMLHSQINLETNDHRIGYILNENWEFEIFLKWNVIFNIYLCRPSFSCAQVTTHDVTRNCLRFAFGLTSWVRSSIHFKAMHSGWMCQWYTPLQMCQAFTFVFENQSFLFLIQTDRRKTSKLKSYSKDFVIGNVFKTLNYC